MYGMVLMAALTAGSGTPDFGFYNIGNVGWNGWGGYGLGWGGWGGYGLGGNGWGGWGGYGFAPSIAGSGYSPMISGWGWGTPFASAGAFSYPGMMSSFYYNPAMNPAMANPPRVARLVVHLPPQASLTVDDHPTLSRSDTRVFITPPLETGKTYTYTLRGEINRDGRFVRETKTVEVKGGELSEVTLRFGDVSREELGAPASKATPSK